MDVFKIVVFFMVTMAIIGGIYTLFIMPSEDPAKVVANTLKLASANPGLFYTGAISFKQLDYYRIKDYLQEASKNLVFSYISFDKSIQVITLSPVPSVDLYKKLVVKANSSKEYDFSTVCYPNFFGFFEGDTTNSEVKLHCVIFFGLKKDDSKLNIDETFALGEYKILQDYNVDLDTLFKEEANYAGQLLISEVQVADFYSNLYLNPDFFKNIVFSGSGKDSISFGLKNVGDYSGLYIYSCPEVFTKLGEIKDNLMESFPVCNMYFKAERMKFSPNTEAMAKTCTATEPLNENEYNFEQGICIKKFGCSGCMAPSLCAEAWKSKTGREYIPYTQDIALTNEIMDYDSCVGGTGSGVVGPTNIAVEEPVLPTPSTGTTDALAGIDYSFFNKVKKWGGKRKGYYFIVIHDGGAWGKSDSDTAVKTVINMWNQGRASTHYYITCEGKIYAILDPANVAWHAGCSTGYIQNINGYSIGIDLRNCEKFSPTHYTTAQMESLNKLINYLSAKYGIVVSDKSVVGHFEVGCHNDPYPDFVWTALSGLKYNHRTYSFYYKKGNKKAPIWIKEMFT